MASAIHAVVCWGSRIKAADANRVKAELCYWGGTRLLGEGVWEKDAAQSTRQCLSAITQNHYQRSPTCSTERRTKSFLLAAISLYSTTPFCPCELRRVIFWLWTLNVCTLLHFRVDSVKPDPATYILWVWYTVTGRFTCHFTTLKTQTGYFAHLLHYNTLTRIISLHYVYSYIKYLSILIISFLFTHYHYCFLSHFFLVVVAICFLRFL